MRNPCLRSPDEKAAGRNRGGGRKAAAGASLQRVSTYGDALACVLHAILTLGSGLWLGPDCDGVLNFSDHQDPARAHGGLHEDAAAGQPGEAGVCGEKQLPEQGVAAVLRPVAAAGKSRGGGGGSKALQVAGGSSNGTGQGAEQAAAAALAAARAKWAHDECVVEAAEGVPGELARARAREQTASEEKREAAAVLSRTQARLKSVLDARGQLGQRGLPFEYWNLENDATHCHNVARRTSLTYAGARDASGVLARIAEILSAEGLCEVPPPPPAAPLHSPTQQQRQQQGDGSRRAANGGGSGGARAAGSDAAASAAAANSNEAGPSGVRNEAAAVQGVCQSPPPHSQQPRPVPLPPGVPIAWVLAAERVAGVRLLERDGLGWIRVLQPEEVADGVGRERLPNPAFAVSQLLDSVQLAPDALEAPVPPAVKSIPKHFQRQVRRCGR